MSNNVLDFDIGRQHTRRCMDWFLVATVAEVPDEQGEGWRGADFATAAVAARGPGFPAALFERSEFSGRPASASLPRGPRRGGSA